MQFPSWIKLMIAVAIQAGILIYYIGSTNATYNARFEAETVRFETDERRILATEVAIQQLNNINNQILEKIARLEEKQAAELETTKRIETLVEGMYRRMQK